MLARREKAPWGFVKYIHLLRHPVEDFRDLQAVLDDLDRNAARASSLPQQDWARILQACGRLKGLALGKRFHTHLAGLDQLDRDPSVGIPLLSMYCKCESVEIAKTVFDRLRERGAVAWTMLIGGYAQAGHQGVALRLFKAMMLEGVRPSEVTIINALTACSSPRELRDGALIHLCAAESQVDCEIAVGNTLVSMYGKCGSLLDAKAVFYSMPLRDLVSWSIAISACSRYQGCEADVLDLFQRMLLEGLSPKHLTLGIVLNACARIEALERGMSIHQSLVQSGMTTLNYAVGIALINLYGRCGRLEGACDAFQAIEERTVVSWNSMMTVLIQHGSCKRAVSLFHEMLQHGFKPTKVTFMTILSSCTKRSQLTDARFLHFAAAQCGFERDVSVANALISMYDACGNLEVSERIFSGMEVRDTISWNGMISAYIQHEQTSMAKTLFRLMLCEGGEPDRATLAHALNAAASLKEVELVHGISSAGTG
ncbi:pentatricopeptide repeat-containing protein At2g39620-like [Selaginella moellendorffii]|uniref:pentatricopeptide repeat-containing protein At2g39620-like n=1 Tax=Selaginella moellendorffii TaxID=88036 RepID=UPI000D1CABF6|nr:pentatricopeptide repeat-containing protein At2g39620-like [Selaginella moellendorffii]|eukprot:XP_024522295.1 pentatricopeptide repeat-containing protein At2g39620-like [Selaginella moellendorffii]